MFDDEWYAALDEGNVEESVLMERRESYSYDDLGTVRSYKDLLVWQRSMLLVETVFELSRRWSRLDQESLGSQIRRAAVSVPSNIAEGYGRRTLPEFAHRLRIAHGSLLEMETQLLIAQRIKLGDPVVIGNALELATRAGQLLQGLLRSIEKKIKSSQ